MFVTTNKKHVLPEHLLTLLKLLESKLDVVDTSMSRDGGKRQYNVTDIRIDEDNSIAMLYICKKDEFDPDPAFSKSIGKGKFATRIVEKEEGEGGGSGAHVAIHLDPKPIQDGHSYYAAIESATGLGRSVTQDLLRAAFKAIYDNDQQSMTSYRTTGSTKKPEPYRPMFEVSGMPKDFLEDDLKKGIGVGLYMQRYVKETKIAGQVSKLRSEERLALLPNPEEKALLPKSVDGLKSLIKGIQGRATSAEYRYKRDGRPHKIKFRIVGTTVTLDEFLVMSIDVGPTKAKMAAMSKDGNIIDEFAVLLQASLLAKIASLN